MKTINDIKNAVLSGNRVFWKNDSYEVIKDSKNQWMIAFRQGQSGENYVGLTYRDGVKSDYNPKDFYIKGKSVNMKTKTKFDSTSDARNLINSVVEKFPKGPERDGLQTKLREFYNCFVGAMRLPQGYDRLKVIEEGTQNLHAAQRIADRVDKQNGNAKFSTMISILASNLTDLKRDHSKAGKVEDKFYGKRVVKGIFAKAMFNFRDVGDAHQKAIAIKTLKNPSWALTGGITAEEAEFILRKKFNYTDKQIAELKKYEGSRTGAKAKFSHLSTMLDMLDYQSANDQEDLAKKNIKGLAQSIGKLNPTKDEWSRYVKIAKSLGFSESQISGFARTGSKAKFAKEYILWAVPKGKTDTMYSQPIAEQLYTDAQINEVKRKATAAGWHTFRIAEMMSFEDMTNVWKGKPVKRRSSRTGSKAKFAQFEDKETLDLLVKELKQLESKFTEFPSDTAKMKELKETIKKIRQKIKGVVL